MGSVSSCCSVEPAKNPETIKLLEPSSKDQDLALSQTKNKVSLTPDQTDGGVRSSVAIDENSIEEFRRRLENSINVTVLLADSTNLSCQIKLKPQAKSLVISCESNFRDVPLNDLKAILHGKDQLRRVETKASLTRDSRCIALHMVTGNCIPIRFNDENEKNCFIELIGRLKKSS